MLRLTGHWARVTADSACWRLEGSSPADLLSPLPAQPAYARFQNVRCISLDSAEATAPRGPGIAATATVATAGPSSGPALARTDAAWRCIPPRLTCLQHLALTSCKALGADDLRALAEGCPHLASLHVHRGAGPCGLPHSQRGGRPNGSASASGGPSPGPTPSSVPPTGGMGLLRLQSPTGGMGFLRLQSEVDGPWPLPGLTFAPLAACAGLRDLGLHDSAPKTHRPPGLPPDALLSIGALTQLRGLSLTGAAACVDLCYCLSALTALTRLELALLPEAWEAAGWRRRQPQPLSLARLQSLRVLSVRLLPLRPVLVGAEPWRRASTEPSPPPEIAGMLRSAVAEGIETLVLDVPTSAEPTAGAHPQPRVFGGIAGGSGGAAGGSGGAAGGSGAERPLAGRLSPTALTCSPEVLSWLLREGMSVGRLEALELRGWRPDDRESPCWHVPERAVAEALRQLKAAAALPPGATGPANAPRAGERGAGAGARRQVAITDRPPPLPLVCGGPAPRLAERLSRVHVSLEEDSPQFLVQYWDQCYWSTDSVTQREAEAVRAKCYGELSTMPCLELDLRLLLRRLPADAFLPHSSRASRGGEDAVDRQPPPLRRADFVQAYEAARLSASAARLLWLPYSLPNLAGLALPFEEVCEHGAALLAAGLTRLRWLSLGRVRLSAWGSRGLAPLGSLSALTRLSFGSISLWEAPPAACGTDPRVAPRSTMLAPRSRIDDAQPEEFWILVEQELKDCCRAFSTRRERCQRPIASQAAAATTSAVSALAAAAAEPAAAAAEPAEPAAATAAAAEPAAAAAAAAAEPAAAPAAAAEPAAAAAAAALVVTVVPPLGVRLDAALRVNAELEAEGSWGVALALHERGMRGACEWAR